MKLAVPQLRYVVIAVFVALSCLPMILISTFLSPKVSPVVFRHIIHRTSNKRPAGMKENELMMSGRAVGGRMVWPAPMRLADTTRRTISSPSR